MKADRFWPTEGWQVSTPEAQGMDGALLDQMMKFVDENQIAVDSVLVVRNGTLVFETYRNGYGADSRHHLQSATKSVTSALVGIALREGLIASVDQTMVDFFHDRNIENLDSRKQAITLENLLTMSDGMDWHELDYPYNDPRNTLGQMWTSRDALQHILDQPMAREPGEQWAYNSGTSMLLGGIVEKVSGQDLLVFAREQLFDPIGIGTVDWDKTVSGYYHSDGGLYMTPRDMARFGYLMLNQGTWEGREILTPEWVDASTRTYYDTGNGTGYGYQWWTFPDMQAYSAHGHYEQWIVVVPEADLVVVFTGNIPDEAVHPINTMLLRYILPSVQDLPDSLLTRQYAGHGLTLDYPAEYIQLETPLPGNDAVTDVGGMVQLYLQWYPSEVAQITWEQATSGITAEEWLAQLFERMPAEGLVMGEALPERILVGGDEASVYPFSAELPGESYSGLAALWRNDAQERFYLVVYLEGGTHPATDFTGKLRGFLETLSFS
ncbi:MAG: serine hydrolase [Caldilineae bacterium]|nr:serine hydrolase [Caldilineae bacterium]